MTTTPPPLDAPAREPLALVLLAGDDPIARRHGTHERPIAVRWRQALKVLRGLGFTCVCRDGMREDELLRLVMSLAERVWRQSELLGRLAEKAEATGRG